MDPFTMALLSTTTGAIQAGAQAAANDQYQRANRKTLLEAQLRKLRGEYLTPEDEQEINLAVVAPAAQQAAEARRRAEQIRHGALANRGGQSGLALAGLAEGEQLARTRAQERGAAALAAGRAQGRRDLTQEIEDRESLRSQMRADDLESLASALPGIMGAVGEWEGRVPGEDQAAAGGGRPMRRQVDWANERAKWDAVNAAVRSLNQMSTPAPAPAAAAPPAAAGPPPDPQAPKTGAKDGAKMGTKDGAKMTSRVAAPPVASQPPLPTATPRSLVSPRGARAIKEVVTRTAALSSAAQESFNSWMAPVLSTPRVFWALVQKTPEITQRVSKQGQLGDSLGGTPAVQQFAQSQDYYSSLTPEERRYVDEMADNLALAPNWYYLWVVMYPRVKDEVTARPFDKVLTDDEVKEAINLIPIDDPTLDAQSFKVTEREQRRGSR